ncbi:hypothetical protein CS369_10910 [Candidatus Symbiopectobacterium sp. 'North America']|uniref:hypothetical protein n=1 Tax=Candidatus Symbiopectobacterium sp. 'North America' TaxID=2794574 RepID=UPI001B35768F|nr:hypothetical protein [Candidatus Symbiopectobacterium sp. 'North America']MBG6245152.1 hypothetical protein [Candidatus Symbiopectobacterium sp. 'North America']
MKTPVFSDDMLLLAALAIVMMGINLAASILSIILLSLFLAIMLEPVVALLCRTRLPKTMIALHFFLLIANRIEARFHFINLHGVRSEISAILRYCCCSIRFFAVSGLSNCNIATATVSAFIPRNDTAARAFQR